MRTPTALAALLCAGLATGPALASSTTIIDFTIEVTELSLLSGQTEPEPFFVEKDIGDEFDGLIEILDPPVNSTPGFEDGLFVPTTFFIESFASEFFSGPRLNVDGSGFGDTTRLSSGRGTDGVFTQLVLSNDSPPSLGPDNFQVADLLAFLASDPQVALFVVNRFDVEDPESGSKSATLRFEVTSASIRPDATVIPLPAAGWLMVAGLGGLAALRRRA